MDKPGGDRNDRVCCRRIAVVFWPRRSLEPLSSGERDGGTPPIGVLEIAQARCCRLASIATDHAADRGRMRGKGAALFIGSTNAGTADPANLAKEEVGLLAGLTALIAHF